MFYPGLSQKGFALFDKLGAGGEILLNHSAFLH